jgi:hypothetical protein
VPDHWIQFPFKNDLASADILAIQETGYDADPNSLNGFTGRTAIHFMPGVEATLVPIMAGRLSFIPDDPTELESYVPGDPLDVTGAFRLAALEDTPGYLQEQLGWDYTIPKYFFYENVRLRDTHIPMIEDKLHGEDVILIDASTAAKLEKDDPADLPLKVIAFLEGKASIKVDQTDELGVVTGSLSLVFGAVLARHKDQYVSASASAMVGHWPIPASYFYTTLRANPTSWDLFQSEGGVHHQDHILTQDLLLDTNGDGVSDAIVVSPLVFRDWTRVRLSLLSWRDYPMLYNNWPGDNIIRGPNPPSLHIPHYLTATDLSPNEIVGTFPTSGETFIPRGPAGLQVTRLPDNEIVQLSLRGAETVTLADTNYIEDAVSVDLIYRSPLTYGVISLTRRLDIMTFMNEIEKLGFSPSTEPAIPHKISAGSADSRSPYGQEIEDVLRSNPHWFYIGGHFNQTLYREVADSPTHSETLEMKFEGTHIEIINEDHTAWSPGGNENIDRKTIDRSELSFTNLRGIFFGGCNPLGRFKVRDNVTSKMADSFKEGDTYPYLFGWQAKTLATKCYQMMSGQSGFFARFGEDPLAPFEDGTVEDYWLQAALARKRLEAALLNPEGEVLWISLTEEWEVFEDIDD